MTASNERKAIRRLIRERRRLLSPAEQRAAALRLRNQLLALPRFRHARNIAAYLAVDSEISLNPAIESAWSLGIPVYLPCLVKARMEFRRYTPGTPLIANRFGIPEPVRDPARRLNARFLDLVLAPLVAFDADGNRLGTGGGYYDRTFAFLKHRQHWNSPRLYGVAYEFQQHAHLPHDSWDVPLHRAVTDTAIHSFPNPQ